MLVHRTLPPMKCNCNQRVIEPQLPFYVISSASRCSIYKPQPSTPQSSPPTLPPSPYRACRASPRPPHHVYPAVCGGHATPSPSSGPSRPPTWRRTGLVSGCRGCGSRTTRSIPRLFRDLDAAVSAQLQSTPFTRKSVGEPVA